MRRHVTSALLVLCLCAAPQVARPEEPQDTKAPPGLEQVLETMQSTPSKELWDYLTTIPEAKLDLLLDHFMKDGRGGWNRRVVSDALGWKMLDRRTEGLRALAPSEEALADAPKLGVLAYPRTDGSTSTIPLERLIACRIFGSPYLWGGPRGQRNSRALSDPPRGGLPLGRSSARERTLAARAARGGVVADATVAGNERLAAIINGLLVSHTGTHGAWVNLITRKKDLVFVARAPSADEKKLAADEGVTLDVVPVARDAFVFLVNRTNPVASLTLEQVRGIYTGKITQWNEVGGPSEKIRPHQRNRNSGSQQLFLAHVMKGATPTVPNRRMISNSMMGPFNAVAERQAALGYTVWYYERYMASLPELKVLTIDGVHPKPETIVDGSYPLVTSVYAAVRADAPSDGSARRLRDWLLTKAGQAVVAESGYVPVKAE